MQPAGGSELGPAACLGVIGPFSPVGLSDIDGLLRRRDVYKLLSHRHELLNGGKGPLFIKWGIIAPVSDLLCELRILSVPPFPYRKEDMTILILFL